MSDGSYFSNENIPLFNMNPTLIGEESGEELWGVDYYKELGVSRASYVLRCTGRILEELYCVYMLPTLPLANIPTLDDGYTDAQIMAQKRDWVWRQPRKELDILTVKYRKSKNPYLDDEGNFLADKWEPIYEDLTPTSFHAIISMRHLHPFYRQNLAPTLHQNWGVNESPSLAIRATNYGNLSGDDVVAVSGSYSEIISVLPKRAVGIIG